jgi:hypothetical protein
MMDVTRNLLGARHHDVFLMMPPRFTRVSGKNRGQKTDKK